MYGPKFKHRASVSAMILALASIGIVTAATVPVTSAHAAPSATTSQATYYSQAELDRLLAPVALYPDSLLTHILIAATYPLEVVQAERWVQQYANLEPQQVLDLAAEQSWDASVKALVGTPDVLKQMSEDLTWTQAVGEAFLAQQEDVLDRVQVLRAHAYDAGHLKSTKHVSVDRADKTIVIENVRREVVYVPYYDTRVVYGSWWHSHPPVYWARPTLTVNIGSGIYWGISYHVPSYFYFSHFFWPQRYVVINHNYYTAPPKKRRDYYMTKHDGKRWSHNPLHRRGVDYRHRDLQPRQPKYHMVRGEAVQPVSTPRGMPVANAPVHKMQVIEPKVRPNVTVVKRQLREAPERKLAPNMDTVRPVVRERPVRDAAIRRPEFSRPVSQPAPQPVQKPVVRKQMERQPAITLPQPRERQVYQPTPRQQPKASPPPVVTQPVVTPPVQRPVPAVNRSPKSRDVGAPVRSNRGAMRDH